MKKMKDALDQTKLEWAAGNELVNPYLDVTILLFLAICAWLNTNMPFGSQLIMKEAPIFI